MTATTRPWVSLACMTGRPDDCNLVHGDGRRCANPAHDAYPDDLQPAGEQPTLDAPVDPPTHLPVVMRRRRWRCPECDQLVIRAEHVLDGGDRMACEVLGVPDAPRTPDPHNHSWKAMDDPHGLYDGPPYLCACGATMDNRRLYPFGTLPDASSVDPPPLMGVPVVVDDTVPPGTVEVRVDGVTVGSITGLEPDPHQWGPDLAAKLAESHPFDPANVPPTMLEQVRRHVLDQQRAAWQGLTDDEKRRIVNAHTKLDPNAALDVAAAILTERLHQ